jgi:thiol-disulfide isomerase/thioredoxin
LKSAQAHERFRADLTRMIDLLLAGQKDAAQASVGSGEVERSRSAPRLPGHDARRQAALENGLAGRVVLVEFWPTWCPPCRGTLGWLGELQKRYGDKLAVVAISVESQERRSANWSRSSGSR